MKKNIWDIDTWTTLRLQNAITNSSPPYVFKSLGKRNYEDGSFFDSEHFPKGNYYELTGAFPLNDSDYFSRKDIHHLKLKLTKTIKTGTSTSKREIPVRIMGCLDSCMDLGKGNGPGGPCEIDVAILNDKRGGRKSRRQLRRKRKNRTHSFVK